jgi:GT2 family glycosyltransferase
LHSFEKNCGVAAAVNVGARLAKGEVLLQADNDVVFGYQSFSGLLEWFQTAPAGIVSPNWPWVQKLLGLEYFHSENDFTKKKFTYLKKVGSRAPLERGRATGSCWICSKKLFERVGGWDENFKNICASDDFRWKIAMCGVELLTVPVGIFHPGKKTRVQIKNNSAQQARDIAFFIEKWGAHPENIAHLNRLLEEKGFSPAQTVTAAYPSLLERLASFFFR